MDKFRISLLPMTLVVLLLVGCSDDDHPTATPPDRISSPDDLMEAFTTAMDDLDIEAMVPPNDRGS